MKVKYDHRSKFSNLSNWKEAWKKSGLQRDSNPLLKLENLLRWSYFTFIYYRSSNMNYFIYTSHHFTHGKIWTQLIDLAPNAWLHSSVGRASYRYRGSHGFESRWSLDFFQASFQLLKLENLLRWSYFTFIYYRSSNMNYFIYTSQYC